jgi:formate dehydrogenase maturation protein FdhE
VVDRNYSFCTHSILRWWIYWELGLKSRKGSSIEYLKNIFVETKINVLAKCPNCETERSPYTISVCETEDTLGTYACRKCETSLKLEDLKKSGRSERKESFIG